MDPEQARKMIVGGELSLPYEILTKGGRRYEVADHANAFIAPAYPDTLILALPRRGIICLGLESIEAIRFEHQGELIGPG